MTYHDELEATALSATEQVLAAFALYQAGRITLEAFRGIVVAFTQAGSVAAATLADLSLSAVLTQQTGRPTAPLGVAAPSHSLDADRLGRAVDTITRDLATGLDKEAAAATATMRLQRLVASETKETAARAYSEAIKKAPTVTGWTRSLSATACQLCQWWSRDGRVWQPSTPMPTHKGCGCTPQPVTKTTTNYQTERQAAERRTA